MSGDATWLIEAIEQRRLIRYSVRGNVSLIEPQMYARRTGNLDVVIALVVEGGPHLGGTNDWLVLEISDNLVPDSRRRFSAAREIPQHIQALVREVYCQAKGK